MKLPFVSRKKYEEIVSKMHYELGNSLLKQDKIDELKEDYMELMEEIKNLKEDLKEKDNHIETLDKQVKDFEPYNALEGGVDGLDFYRAITSQAKDYLKEGGILAYEVGHDQSEDVSKLMEKDGYTNIYTRKDLQQIDRVVIGNVL